MKYIKYYILIFFLFHNINVIYADTNKQVVIKDVILLSGDKILSKKIEKPILSESGSINVWIKPDKVTTEKSKPILTFRWNDKKNGYLALTHGWWEPLSSNSIFLIVNNQDKFHCSVPYNIDIEAWSMITAVWKTGKYGFCKIYVDAIKAASSKHTSAVKLISNDTIFIGNDYGATDRRNRKFIGQIADLTMFNQPLNEQEIISLYNNPKFNNTKNTSDKNKWLGNHSTHNNPEVNHDFKSENRVIFDPDIMWSTSKNATDTILEKVKAAGFNTYVPYVWHGRGTYFISKTAHLHNKLTKSLDGSYDPLTYLISKAHSLGIEVHPCIVITRREDDQYPQYYDHGTPKNAYNVHIPEFRHFIHNLLMEVVSNYDVDGVNLDYIRTMGICNSEFCQKDYYEKTSNNFNTDYYLKYISADARKRIQAWQDNAITGIVKNFSINAKKIKPNLIISVDAHPVPTGEKRPLNGRNAVQWSNDNLIDVIFSMDYRKKIDYKKADRVYQSLINKKSFIPLFANYDIFDKKAVRRPGDLMVKYVEFSRQKWPEGGFAVWLLHQMSEEQVKSLANGPFSKTANTSWH